MKHIKTYFLATLFLALISGCQGKGESTDTATDRDTSLERVKQAGILHWGADVIGGVPYVFEDSKNPGSYIGFEMDIAEAIARHLGVEQQMVIKAWDSLIPELQRGSFDMAMNGIEDTEDRRKIVLFSVPYFAYAQQITVRKDTEGINHLKDLQGKRVATLSGSAAEDILRGIPDVGVKINPEIIYSYKDLEDGKVDGVLLDTPIAAAYGATNPKLKNVGQPFGEGTYVIAFRKQDKALQDAVNEALKVMKENGELRAIYRKWRIMDAEQEKIGINLQ